MKLPIDQINAFASGPFSGNPAAVCPLSDRVEDDLLQRIAAETQLTTALPLHRFVVPRPLEGSVGS